MYAWVNSLFLLYGNPKTSEIRMYNKKVILQCLVKYWILFALVFVLQKLYWTGCHRKQNLYGDVVCDKHRMF